MPEIVILLIIGSIAGVMSGMFGIGGGAIIVPFLVLFLGMDQYTATGTSLAALLLPVGVFGCLEYYRNDKLKIVPSLAVAIGLASGSWFGANIALGLDARVLQGAYGAFLILMAYRYIGIIGWIREIRGDEIEQVRTETTTDFSDWRNTAFTFGIGLVAGLASGLFGIGGGVVIVPALMILMKFDQKMATGTSLGALLLPVGLPAVWRYTQDSAVDFWAAVPIAVLLLIGAGFGARLTLSLPTKLVRRLYGFFLLAVGLRFLFVALAAVG